ncbi:MAG: hypothetical protein ACFFC7_31855 [Candidatus Hermodarchaeota archaeon]
MKILILGNIGAGKTTIAKKIQSEFSFNLCTIDDCRRLYGDGTVPGEYLALYHFLQSCLKKGDTILEFTGAGCHKFAIKKALEDSTDLVLVIFVQVAIPICQKRIAPRQWDIPIPSWDFNLKKHLNFVEEELNSDYEKEFWAASDRFTAIMGNNEHENDLERIVKLIIAEINEIKSREK